MNNDPVNMIDPLGLFNSKKLILGILQIGGAFVEAGASYSIGAAAEAGSAGTLTPAVAILVTIATGDAARNLAEGAGKIAAAFDDDSKDISVPQEVTGNIAQALGASEETEQTVKNVTNGLETVCEFLMPGKPEIQAASMLVDKVVPDSAFDSIDEKVNGTNSSDCSKKENN